MVKSLRGPLRRKTFWRLVVYIPLVIASIVAWWLMIRMPGNSFRDPLPALSADETTLRDELRRDVQKLAGEIGPRNVDRYAQLTASADFIASEFTSAGFSPRRDSYDLYRRTCENIDVELPGTDSKEIVVIGAHYDTVPGSPGANDNGSGVAGTLALARRFAGKPCARTLRFVAFVNEEPVNFQTQKMGSWVYASRCKERCDRISAMISLETIGYFSDEPGSQHYPMPMLNVFYPGAGNFIAIVGNVASRSLVRQVTGSFRKDAQFPSEGAALPSRVPGISWSDHWSFWEHGYPALMVTDTAPFRYPHYHSADDTPDKLDYDSMARVVHGLENVIVELAGGRE
jgi:hypothetical protein